MKVRRKKSKSTSENNNSSKDMKTTMPNKEKESVIGGGMTKGKSTSQQVSSGNSSTTMSPISGATSVVTSKDGSSRTLLAKELEEINKKLTNVSLTKGRKSGGGGSGDASSQPENEIKLLEKKILVLLKMKNWKDVRDEGYKILGKKGPNAIIYKCILVSLCRLGKVGSEFEDDVLELLDHWKNSTPKCSQMQDTKRKMEGFLTAIRSGVDPGSLLQNLQDVLGLNAVSMPEVSASEPNWRFRPPPPRHNTFALCSRISGDSSSTCIYGEDCVLAHSKEELKEWQIRAQWTKMKSAGGDGISPVMNLLANGQSHTSPSTSQTLIFKDKIPQSYRALPNACMYYLLGLNRKVSEADNISTIFKDSLPDVKFKSTTPLIVQKVFGNSLPLTHKWTFMVASKHPLATVTLYNDTHRDFFAVSAASFINTKRERIDLIEIHPNNQNQKGIQVLNTFIKPDLFLPFNSGWPEWCCYQIEVTFQTMLYVPKVYEQEIIFDFKSDPKILKKLSITVEEPSQITHRPIESNTSSIQHFSYAQASKRSCSNSKSISASESDDENNSDGELSANLEVSNINCFPEVSSVNKVYNNLCYVPTPVQKPVPLMELNTSGSAVKPPISKQTLTQKLNESEVLFSPSPPIQEIQLDAAEGVHRSNYKTWMSLFLRAELRLRQDSLASLSGTVKMNLSKPDATKSRSKDTWLVGELRLARDVNKDSKLGRLLLSSCHGMSIRKLSEDVNSRPRFCRFIEKMKHPVKISIDENTVSEFQLSEGTEEMFEICLFLEQSYLPFINSIFHSHSFRDRHLDVLFPKFNESDEWDINSIVQSRLECTVEEKCTLNTKQREAYQTIVSPPGPQNSRIPILLTGPSGSGKSYLIAHSVVKLSKQLSNADKSRTNRIAICTYSDFSANQYITQFLPAFIGNSSLKDDLVPLRIYSVEEDANTVFPDVKKYCVFDETGDGKIFRIPSCQEIYSKRIIVFTIKSCVELLKLGLLSETFSYIFVDEAECMLEAEAVCPVILAGDTTKVVLSGDLMKLQPESFLSEFFCHPTVLQRLEKFYPARHPMKCKLEELYCNHKDIVQFISDEFYNSSLKCAQSQSTQSFPLSFCVVHGGEDSQPEYGEGYYNMPEVYEVRDRVLSLVKAWPPSWGSARDHSSIVVITPYADQAYALRVRLELNGLSFVDVETLPNVTNKRYKVVILSPVRVFKSDNAEKTERYTDCGFLTNRRAIYTAFSRAENIIMVVGDLTSLCKHCCEKELWRQYISLCQRNGSLIGIQNLGIYAPILQSESGFLSAEKHAEIECNIQPLAASASSTPAFYLQSHLQYDMAPVNNHLDQFVARVENVESSNTNSNLDRLSSIWDSIPSVNQSNSIRNFKLPKTSDQNKIWEYSGLSNKSHASAMGSTPSSVWNSPSVAVTSSLSSSSGAPSDQTNLKLQNDKHDTEFQNVFDLPDVKLLAEAALSGNSSRARHHTQIQTPFTYTTKSPIPQKSFATQSKLPAATQQSHFSVYDFPGLPEVQNSYSLFNPPRNTLQRAAAVAPSSASSSLAQDQHESNSNIINLTSLNQLPRRQGFAPPPRMRKC